MDIHQHDIGLKFGYPFKTLLSGAADADTSIAWHTVQITGHRQPKIFVVFHYRYARLQRVQTLEGCSAAMPASDSNGSRNWQIVPLPSRVFISKLPPIFSNRCRMFDSPSPDEGAA